LKKSYTYLKSIKAKTKRKGRKLKRKKRKPKKEQKNCNIKKNMTSQHISKKPIARLKGRREKEIISIRTRRGRNP